VTEVCAVGLLLGEGGKGVHGGEGSWKVGIICFRIVMWGMIQI
jgi:hypothetical protein